MTRLCSCGILAVFTLAGLAPDASAQDPRTGGVSGAVFDSVARAPLRDAMVQMVPPAGTPLFTATTDARGQYSITGAPPGRYFIEFHHRVLDSLALEPPLRAVEVRAGESAKLDLAVPAPATIVSQLCRTTPRDSLGLLFGLLRDSRSRMGQDSGQVTARWFELVIDTSGLTNNEHALSSPTNREGWFAICGVPAGVEVLLRARRSADSSGLTLVSIPAHGLRRFDVDVGGTASLRGHILSRQKPVFNARVRSGGEERGVFTDSSGAFRIAVPAGTQTIEVRALGYAPETRAVTLSPDSESVMDVELTTVKRVMDTIQVVAQRVYSIDAVGFERRRRAGGGMFFDRDLVRRRSPYSVLQLLNEVPSVRIQQVGLDRTVLFRRFGSLCTPAFYLNGIRMPSELLSDLDFFVRPHELEGMEVYRNMGPAEFSSPCGSIVVWTRRSPRPKS